MSLEAFTDAAADYQIYLENLADEKRPIIQKLFRELLNSPEMRTPEITFRFLESEIENGIAEGDDPELVGAYWESIADLVELSFDEINSIPLAERGDKFDTARELMVAAAMYEAMIRSSMLVDAMAAGGDFGVKQSSLLRGVKREQVKSGHMIRPRIKEKKSGIQGPAA